MSGAALGAGRGGNRADGPGGEADGFASCRRGRHPERLTPRFGEALALCRCHAVTVVGAARKQFDLELLLKLALGVLEGDDALLEAP